MQTIKVSLQISYQFACLCAPIMVIKLLVFDDNDHRNIIVFYGFVFSLYLISILHISAPNKICFSSDPHKDKGAFHCLFVFSIQASFGALEHKFRFLPLPRQGLKLNLKWFTLGYYSVSHMYLSNGNYKH